MSNSLEQLLVRKRKLGALGALDFLIDLEAKKCVNEERPAVSYEPFFSSKIDVPEDLERFKKRPAVLPPDIKLPPVKGAANDYRFLLSRLDRSESPGVSVVILNYNRSLPLEKTLTGLLNQNYDLGKLEVIVADDGSREDTMNIVRKFDDVLNVKYVWHPDVGFTAAKARNNGVALAKNELVVLLDVDMYPAPDLISEYAKYHRIIDQVVVIGPRKYKDFNNTEVSALRLDRGLADKLPEVSTNNAVADQRAGEISVDWRLDTFKKTNNLVDEKLPFRMFAAGNVAFSKSKFDVVGGFDERFTAWGFEDGELAFRLFNEGLYMVSDMEAWAYHQEPPGGENETDRSAGKSISGDLYGNVCPYYRKLTSQKDFYESPRVSIYIPAYNAESTILDAVESALDQTYTDVEVCICDDGSTDRTLAVLERYYSSNPRVRWVSQKNGGIGAASNTALSLTKGIYIGQLDSDDILAKDAVEKCVPYFEKDMNVGLVYTSYENEHPDGSITPGYNYPVFTREKLTTAMIAHHFRMFRRRDWARVGGFNERLKNAVDFDFYLRLSERCHAKHLNIRSYRRRLHGANTSLVDNAAQNKNASIAVNQSLMRQGLSPVCSLEDPLSPKLIFG